MRPGTPTWYEESIDSPSLSRLLNHAQIAVKNCFIRGSVVRYVQIPADAVDTQLLEDATRRGPCLCHPVSAFPDRDLRCRGPQPNQTVKPILYERQRKLLLAFCSAGIHILSFFRVGSK